MNDVRPNPVAEAVPGGPACPLHRAALAPGRKSRVAATALAGRKHAFHAAERERFPHAAAFHFCREGSLACTYCPACRRSLAAWLDRQNELGRHWDDLAEALGK